MLLRAGILTLGLISHVQIAAGAPFSLTSGTEQVALLELYTSEGCSSCPPADRWLSALKDDPRLWTEIVPVAFHVDYWDYIGWKDRFASPAYGARQRRYAEQQAVRAVYTPGFVYNGEEWRQWFTGRYHDVPSSEAGGALTLELGGGQARVRYTPVTRTGELEASLVLLGGGLSSEIKAGENRGRRLEHDFVVLGLVRAPLVRAGNEYSAMLPMPTSTAAAKQYAIAAWVSPSAEQGVLQSVGGWLPADHTP